MSFKSLMLQIWFFIRGQGIKGAKGADHKQLSLNKSCDIVDARVTLRAQGIHPITINDHDRVHPRVRRSYGCQVYSGSGLYEPQSSEF